MSKDFSTYLPFPPDASLLLAIFECRVPMDSILQFSGLKELTISTKFDLRPQYNISEEEYKKTVGDYLNLYKDRFEDDQIPEIKIKRL